MRRCFVSVELSEKAFLQALHLFQHRIRERERERKILWVILQRIAKQWMPSGQKRSRFPEIWIQNGWGEWERESSHSPISYNRKMQRKVPIKTRIHLPIGSFSRMSAHVRCYTWTLWKSAITNRTPKWLLARLQFTHSQSNRQKIKSEEKIHENHAIGRQPNLEPNAFVRIIFISTYMCAHVCC